MRPPLISKTVRRVGWSLAALLAVGVWVVLASIVPGPAPWFAAVVTFGGVGLAVEFTVLVRDLKQGAASPPRVTARPADGVVRVVPLRGVCGSPLTNEPRFQRFESFEPDAAASLRRDPHADGRLLGRVCLTPFFIGRDGRRWQDDEMAATLRALLRSAAWLEAQAQRWGAGLNVDLADTVFEALDPVDEPVEVQFVPEGDHMGPFEAQAVPKAIASASRAAAALGFPDITRLMRAVSARLECEEIVWVVLPRCAGRSLAIPEAESPLPGTAMAVCYARESNFPEPLDGPPFPDPTTFVHEILHLFGATDKYDLPLGSYPRGMVSDRDVMCLYQTALPRLRVDRLTAAEVGWTAPGAASTG
jgi:hypothetical protein